MDELVREFVIESQEGLDRMERSLTDLEARPGDAELLAEIFRTVHTIKGATGFLGFARLEKLAHAGENVLGLLRDGHLAADGAVVSTLLELLDNLRSLLKNIEARGSDEDPGAASDDDSLIGRLEQCERLARTDSPWSISVLKELPGEGKPGSSVTSPSVEAEEALLPSRRHGSSGGPESSADSAAVAAEQCQVPAGQAADGFSIAANGAADSTLRVDVKLLNRLMNLVGELVLIRNQVLQATAADPNMTVLSRRLDMLTADLRENVMRARMQPVSSIFGKFPRMVRDLSRGLGRRVRLEMEGQETELDKSLLETLKDPVTHAVRNALDHGLEPPELRAAAGKNPEGLLRLRAAQEGSHVLVEVTDDGAGICAASVRERAVERGIISRDRAAALPEGELLTLIFLPGFSTARQITNVSGRGVGMDVVRTNVEKIGGKVELESQIGRGTTVRMRIPLTLAIVPALIVRSLGQSFAIPQNALSELVHLSLEQARKAIEWIEDAPVYRLRGQLLPLVFLDRLLGSGPKGETADACFLAVLEVDERKFGLVVDGLADPEEIVVKPLSPILKQVGVYTGATVLGNGELALILDPGAIAARAGVSLAAGALSKRRVGVLDEEQAADPEFLVVKAGGRQSAIPLEWVLRIEQVERARIDYAMGRLVLNLSGSLLPVQDPGGYLSRATAAKEDVLVVVCQDGNRHAGIVVEEVLDVARGSGLRECGTGKAISGLWVLRESVTGLLDLNVEPDVEPAVPVMPSGEDPRGSATRAMGIHAPRPELCLAVLEDAVR